MKLKNPRVVIYSLIGLIFLFLTFKVDWLFIIGALLMIFLSQKELMKKK